MPGYLIHSQAAMQQGSALSQFATRRSARTTRAILQASCPSENTEHSVVGPLEAVNMSIKKGDEMPAALHLRRSLKKARPLATRAERNAVVQEPQANSTPRNAPLGLLADPRGAGSGCAAVGNRRGQWWPASDRTYARRASRGLRSSNGRRSVEMFGLYKRTPIGHFRRPWNRARRGVFCLRMAGRLARGGGAHVAHTAVLGKMR